MKFEKPGLQGKFIIALLVAAALPFLAGLIAFETIGYREFLAERGERHQIEAVALVRALDQASEAKGEELKTWITADRSLITAVSVMNDEAAGEDPEQIATETRRLDEAWPSLTFNDAQITSVVSNPASHSLNRYRQLHPEVAEILATDKLGRLVAATGKSSDFDQADEKWWQDGAELAIGSNLTDDLSFDASSGVFSLDVIMPLHNDDQFAGVAKVSMDVTSLFSRLAFGDGAISERCEILLPDGRILASSMAGFASLAVSISSSDLEKIREEGNGWTVTTANDGRAWMTGFVALGMDSASPNGYILFLSPRDELVAPLRRNFLLIGAAGATLLLICALAGFYLVRLTILNPLAMLGAATRSISETAKIGSPLDGNVEEIRQQKTAAEVELQRIQTIQTGDEIQSLASDLAVMSSRVLRYHRELESEVSAKTAVIREDLELAREFQRPCFRPDIHKCRPRVATIRCDSSSPISISQHPPLVATSSTSSSSTTIVRASSLRT